ncbi:E3 ubiquitin-protein ligase At3g02290-like [Tasmannia lanceolata]|uniref:E3 ubiquitin-protein ligase At3g02290-like n=1 Tax=Tasmannia lanceolata TaxID=3420 RepID=UPI0040632B5D
MKPFFEFLEDEGLKRDWTSHTLSSAAGASKLPKIEPEKSVQPKTKEDVCSTCLEEYTKEKPGAIATCGHHFHVECFIAWRKKSETCPICAQEGIQPSLAMGDS